MTFFYLYILCAFNLKIDDWIVGRACGAVYNQMLASRTLLRAVSQICGASLS